MAAGHREHGFVSRKGRVVWNGQWGQELLGIITEIFQGIKAILVHIRRIAPWDIGGDETQFVVSCKLQQGMVVREVVGPKVGGGFQFVVTHPSSQKFVQHKLVVCLHHFGTEHRVNIDVKHRANEFGLQPMHDRVIVVFAKEHHIGVHGFFHKI